MKKHNFSAGPAILPATVLEQAVEAARDFNGTGLSILEVSHRSPGVVAVMQEAKDIVRRLLKLTDEQHVLFLQGGASTQFSMVPFNLLNKDAKAAYINTGSWSTKAIKEAKLFGEVEVVASSEESNFNFIPKNFSVPADAAYLHFTSNNTIYGTQYKDLPDTNVPLVADMSSDIFSHLFDASRFDVIYAGAQRNMGPAGATLAIVHDRILEQAKRDVPTMYRYKTHVDKKSMFNTPPVFSVYVSMLTLRWMEEMGGLEAMAERNRIKANILYSEIDSNPLFEGTAALEDRSTMNVPFVMNDKELEARFLKRCEEEGCSGLKGHRSVGGLRASIYNAMENESVELLVQLMQEFATVHA